MNSGVRPSLYAAPLWDRQSLILGLKFCAIFVALHIVAAVWELTIEDRVWLFFQDESDFRKFAWGLVQFSALAHIILLILSVFGIILPFISRGISLPKSTEYVTYGSLHLIWLAGPVFLWM